MTRRDFFKWLGFAAGTGTVVAAADKFARPDEPELEPLSSNHMDESSVITPETWNDLVNRVNELTAAITRSDRIWRSR